MLRSFVCLLLVILSLSHYIDSAESAPEPQLATTAASWVSHLFRGREPISVSWRIRTDSQQFYYLAYDNRKNYLDITQAPFDKPKGGKVVCRYNFHPDDKDVQGVKLSVPEEKDVISLSFTTAASRGRKMELTTKVDFKACNKASAPEGVVATPALPDDKREEHPITEEAAPVQAAAVNGRTLTSDSKSFKTSCLVSANGRQITCTQKDWHDKVLLNNVKYDLPEKSKADWWGVHNVNSGAVLVVFGRCDEDYCQAYEAVRLTDKGVAVGPLNHGGMDLHCSDPSKIVSEASDHSGGSTCVHVMCPETLYKKKSDVKVETTVHYRAQCLKGDAIN